jgi:hypothetical protein
MTSNLSAPLAPEHLRVLHFVATTNLTSLGPIVQQAGGNANVSLMTLRDGGYVTEHLGRQRNGAPANMYSISAKGKDALKENAPRIEPTSAPETGWSTPDRGVYMGHEIRAFAGRAGAMDAFQYPSRVGARLYHRDGSVTLVSATE